MSKDELVLSDGKLWQTLSEDEENNIQAKLWKLLAKRTGFYTMGESSSVRVETAQELLQSIIFCLDLYLKQSGKPRRFLAQADLEELFKLGLKEVEEQIELGKKLFQIACNSAPEIENTSYKDTLISIGDFFKRYDYRFFAQHIPCDIDYQLCNPVNDSLQGIEYINQYLGRIIIENDFVKRFEKNRVTSLLESYCSDYRGLLINIYAPVAANAIGLSLLQEDISVLDIRALEKEQLAKFFEPLTVTPAKKALSDAADRVCREININDASSARYLRKTANELYPRIESALPHGNLDGIFLSFNNPADADSY